MVLGLIKVCFSHKTEVILWSHLISEELIAKGQYVSATSAAAVSPNFVVHNMKFCIKREV